MEKIKMKYIVLILILLSVVLKADTLVQETQDRAGDYELVFHDEFSLRDGSQPDAKIWSRSRRGTSTWNRWISNAKDVVFIKNGKLICRAMRNRDQRTDTAAMLTGAVDTQHKFSFQYGRIEVRAKTNLHSGNFPAIWLMPQPPAENHPYGGEIDIFESFGTHRDAHHTVHTHWTLNLKHADKPRNNFVKTYFDVNKWHVYALEWTPTSLIFLIDGKVTGVYNKSRDVNVLAQKQWPFDHPFYIILNQSVQAQGSWAGSPDLNYVYETQFDWVRVYQKKTHAK